MTELDDRLLRYAHQLAELDQQLAPLLQEKERVRAKLLPLVQVCGGKVTLPGVARMEVSKASVAVSYDRKQLEQVILRLVDNGQYHIADALRACKRESQRPPVLRILRDVHAEQPDEKPLEV